MYCLECELLPCMAGVEEHLRNAFEKYEMEELRKEAEFQMAEKKKLKYRLQTTTGISPDETPEL